MFCRRCAASSFRPPVPDAPFSRVRPQNARPPAHARARARKAGPSSPPRMSWNVMFLSRRRAAGPSAGGRDSGLMLRALGFLPSLGGRGRGRASRRGGRLPGFARRFRWRGSGPPPGLPRKRERGLPVPGGTGSNRRPPPATCACCMADIPRPLRNVMECHDRHVLGAWSVLLSGMRPAFGTGSSGSPSGLASPACVSPFDPSSFPPPPAACGGTLYRAYRVGACARARAGVSRRRGSRTRLPARESGAGRTSPVRSVGFFFRTGAKRSGPAEAASFYLHSSTAS